MCSDKGRKLSIYGAPTTAPTQTSSRAEAGVCGPECEGLYGGHEYSSLDGGEWWRCEGLE